MAEKIKAWQSTCKRFVAFLDIMGFRDMVLRNKHEDIKEMFEYLCGPLNIMEKSVRRRFSKKEVKLIDNSLKYTVSHILPVTFSDSIIFISDDDSSDSARDLLLSISLTFFRALFRGIPLKGAIAYGEFTADIYKSLYFGKPLIDAYELQNELFFYGIVLHHTIEKRLIEMKVNVRFEGYSILCNYPVPMKSARIKHNVLDWTIFSRVWQKKALDLVPELYNNVSGAPRLYVDHTEEFARWIIARKIELDQKERNKKSF